MSGVGPDASGLSFIETSSVTLDELLPLLRSPTCELGMEMMPTLHGRGATAWVNSHQEH